MKNRGVVAVIFCVALLGLISYSYTPRDSRSYSRNTQNQEVALDNVMTATRKTRQQVVGYYSYRQHFAEFGPPPKSALSPNIVVFDDIIEIFYYHFRTDAHGYIFSGNSTADANILFGPHAHHVSQLPPAPNSEISENKVVADEAGVLHCSHDGHNSRECVRRDTKRGLLYRLHQENKRVYLRIDGIGVQKQNTFAILADNSSARRMFSEQCVSILTDYEFDGILLGWHYPHPEFDDWGDSTGDDHYYDNFHNYKLLLNNVYSQLKKLSSLQGSSSSSKEFILSAYLTCDKDEIQRYDFEQLSKGLLFTYWTDAHTHRNIRFDEKQRGGEAEGFSVSGANSGYCLKLYVKI